MRGKKGALQATQDPNVPNNNTGIIISIIPVLILVIIYLSEVGGSLLRCGMLSGKICEDQR